MVSEKDITMRVKNWNEYQAEYYKTRKFVCNCCGQVVNRKNKVKDLFICNFCRNNNGIEIMKLKSGIKLTNDTFGVELNDY